MHNARDYEVPLENTVALGERPSTCCGDPPRAMVVSDVRLYRETLTWRLAQSGRVSVVGAVERGDLAVDQAAALHPDVVLIDRAIPESLTIAKAIEASTGAKVVAFAIGEADHAVIECAEAGLAGFVPRDASIDELVE